jgi:hypothetical protein
MGCGLRCNVIVAVVPFEHTGQSRKARGLEEQERWEKVRDGRNATMTMEGRCQVYPMVEPASCHDQYFPVLQKSPASITSFSASKYEAVTNLCILICLTIISLQGHIIESLLMER